MPISPVERYALPYAASPRGLGPLNEPPPPIRPASAPPSSTRERTDKSWTDELTLSVDARALVAKADGATSPAEAENGASATKRSSETECKTCSERKYKDESDDPTVSFQTAQHLSPESAAAAVQSHESEHVRNEQARAAADGKKVVHQQVAIHTATCPECGRVYVSGGTTTTQTLTKASPPDARKPEAGASLNLLG